MEGQRLIRGVIPHRFLQWLAESRISFLNDLKDGRPMRYFSAHLPIMATWREGVGFPVNLTVKGIGLLPKSELLEHYIDIFESVIAEARSVSWDASLQKRIEVMLGLYGDIENLDPSFLGGLEIFEGRAFENMRENPYASLLYVGMSHTADGIRYISFQINGNVEILNKDNQYYRFLLASRRLFEFDKFHIYQPDYPFGYLIRVVEVRDKSPWPRSKRPLP